ncbi:hypothetical protein DFQ11_102721 [Winogradskyella epiphytica]|uniref:Glycosyl transferase family 2 n=1 Tax=Winogradskyella epiphytica TaxID=262005 RepID=A0A2V4WY12_9FLAO|nr:glycosyltransferase [Winogradskyella epiphytica]PYE82140.1 hypothetical protein DFQ11_102721 [Winogradskyella epiphytica]
MIHFLYNYFLTRKPLKKANRVNHWLHWQLYKYLKVNLVAHYKTVSINSLEVDDASTIIVSLTSFPGRIDVVYLAIRSILNQTLKPKKIVLWLGKDQFPLGEEELPQALLELIPLGLDIEFCEDIGAHTKYYYAFQKYPDNLIVTVDDDIIYPTQMLSRLMETHHKHPHCVVANRIRYMEIKDHHIKPYRQWKINIVGSSNPSKMLFATGVGGVLYQPRFFQDSFFDLEGIKKTNCIGDDVWLKAGQIASGIPVVFTDFYFEQFLEIPESQKETLFSKNVFDNDNDRQVKEVFEYFGITEKSFD